MKEKSWGQHAREAVHEGYTELKAQYPDLDDAAIMRKVSREYYPWGSRENWPYQAWLKAVKGYRQKLVAPTPAEKNTPLPLFEDAT